MQSVVCTCNYKHRTIDSPDSLSRRRVLLPTKIVSESASPVDTTHLDDYLLHSQAGEATTVTLRHAGAVLFA